MEELLVLFYMHIFKKVLSVVSPGHYLLFLVLAQYGSEFAQFSILGN